jgi:hypothetical protein
MAGKFTAKGAPATGLLGIAALACPNVAAQEASQPKQLYADILDSLVCALV